jgi:hypothetical protein
MQKDGAGNDTSGFVAEVCNLRFGPTALKLPPCGG